MDNLDFKGLNLSNLSISSAFAANQFAEQQREQQIIFDEIAEQNAKRNATIMAGAEASVAQKELLELQLAEVKEQNLQLKENYRLLNELYESAKADAKSNAKDAMDNKIFGWVSLGVGTLIGIVGIVLGILF